MPGFTSLTQMLKVLKRELSNLLEQASKAAIAGSYRIWCTMQEQNHKLNTELPL